MKGLWPTLSIPSSLKATSHVELEPMRVGLPALQKPVANKVGRHSRLLELQRKTEDTEANLEGNLSNRGKWKKEILLTEEWRP